MGVVPPSIYLIVDTKSSSTQDWASSAPLHQLAGTLHSLNRVGWFLLS